jgi:L-rhamnose mutarotase
MNQSDQPRVRRFGQVIELRPEKIDEYKRLHAGPGVRDLLRQANLRNFAIYLKQFDDGRYFEFAYYEYTGSDFEADMAWLGAQPANQAWLAQCDPMQIPLAGETSWAAMDEIFFNE